MVNPRIAPPADLNVDERIAEIEKFLEEQEKKAVVTNSKQIVTKPPSKPSPIPRTSPINNPNNEEMINLLRQLVENQEIDRVRYEQSNPVAGDEAIYDWNEATINPGQLVQFIYTVPEGHVFFLEYVNIVHQVNTTYYIWIDGQFQPTLSYAIEDFGDHMPIWKPPKMVYNNVQVWALNNGIVAQTYATFFRGFNRWHREAKRNVKYKSVTEGKEAI